MSAILQLNENIFLETNIQSTEYDGAIIPIYPDEFKGQYPTKIGEFVANAAKIDKNIHKAATVWNCEFVCGGRLVLAPTGKITPYHDVSVVKEAVKNGVTRAIDAGVKKPLIILCNISKFPNGNLLSILGALEALYTPIQIRELDSSKVFPKIGFVFDGNKEQSYKVMRNAIAVEKSRIVTRDIAGGDPERMTPAKIVDYIKQDFAQEGIIKIKVIDDVNVITKEYPLMAAVNRGASVIDRHKPRILELEYLPTDASKVTETLLLVGKGVTFDSGGVMVKPELHMIGMSRDKSGAAAIAGFVKACALFKPPHLKVIGVLCLCRNSIGENSYVADELLVSRSGKTVRVVHTDAEGRFAMADALFKMSEIATKEVNPHIYTIATLTGHAVSCYGKNTAAIDNYKARLSNHSLKLQESGSLMGEGIEVSNLKPIDFTINEGLMKGDDIAQINTDAKSRHHQLAAGFLIKAGGLEDKDVKYTHLDIAGAAGIIPLDEPTAVPILALCHAHKVLIE